MWWNFCFFNYSRVFSIQKNFGCAHLSLRGWKMTILKVDQSISKLKFWIPLESKPLDIWAVLGKILPIAKGAGKESRSLRSSWPGAHKRLWDLIELWISPVYHSSMSRGGGSCSKLGAQSLNRGQNLSAQNLAFPSLRLKYWVRKCAPLRIRLHRPCYL